MITQFIILIYLTIIADNGKNLKFDDFLINKKQIVISRDNNNSPYSFIKMLDDITFIIYNNDKKTIKKVNYLNKVDYIIDVSKKSSKIIDVFTYKDKIFLLESNKTIINVFDTVGNIVKLLRIKESTKISKLNDSIFLTYNTLYLPGKPKNIPIHTYNYDGKYLFSFGNIPEKPTIDLAPFISGNIFTKDEIIYVCHGVEFVAELYSKSGQLIKQYNRKPTFFYKPDSLKEISEPYITYMYSTTHHAKVFPVNNKFIVSYYYTTIGDKKWLYIQSNDSVYEVKIPNKYTLLLVSDNKMYFLIDAEDKSNYIIDCYEIKTEYFK